MLVPGRQLIPHIIGTTVDAALQTQPCSASLTLKYVRSWASPAAVFLDGKISTPALIRKLPFAKWQSQRHKVTPLLREILTPKIDEHFPHRGTMLESIHLKPGHYQVEFTETVDMPFDKLGQIFTHQNILRAGASIVADPIKSGTKGEIHAMLQVVNREGILLFRQAQIAHMIVHELPVEVVKESSISKENRVSADPRDTASISTTVV